ncbi:hypothetical protein Ccrd_026084 [Cynara cardunculus var. scolymus]|uniref:Uncharacterized protein n=1 Tax=Cynara cardunculus var. scolymus TaxID=59895 RepID=A0A103SSN2_CYNCS|nr:hypothetical protein Ccrd_026084 [Cynara cardunculus var. scolymus]
MSILYANCSQDPINGVYQTSDQFWFCVEETYNNENDTTWTVHPKKKATRKLHASNRQWKNRHQGGASNVDILGQAKQMLSEDPKFKNGWKFDHVCSIIKDFEKFQDENTRTKQIPI